MESSEDKTTVTKTEKEEITERTLQSLKSLEKWVKDGKDEQKVKDLCKEIRIALDIPKECLTNNGHQLENLLANLLNKLHIVQNSTLPTEWISDEDVLKNASGGLALEGVYLTRNPEDLLAKREQLIDIPDPFSLTSPEHQVKFEQREFSSHHSENVFHKVMEKLGDSFSCSVNFGFKAFGSSFWSGPLCLEEAEKTSLNTTEQSYMLHTKYNYVPKASAYLKKHSIQLTTGALQELQRIEILNLCSGEEMQLHNTVKRFYEQFGSHINQGPIHFGGVFWWKATVSGFKSTDLSVIRKMAAESLDVYCGAGYGFGQLDASAKMGKSSSEIKGTLSRRYSEDLLSRLNLSICKSGGPAEIDDHFIWKSHLAGSNKTWSIIDKGMKLIPVWEIILVSHRNDFENVSEFSIALRDVYTKVTGIFEGETWGENFFSEINRADALLQSVNDWTTTDCESHLLCLLKAKSRIFAETKSYELWEKKYFLNETLQNYFHMVATDKSLSEASHLKALMRVLFDNVTICKLMNYPQKTEIMKWAYQSEHQPTKWPSISEFYDLLRVVRDVERELSDTLLPFNLEENNATKVKALEILTHNLNSFRHSLLDQDQNETDLLILSVISAFGYIQEQKTFNHLLDKDEISCLRCELEEAFDMYTNLKRQCSKMAQAFILQTALTLRSKKVIENSQDRLEHIKMLFWGKVSPEIQSLIEENRDLDSLLKALETIRMGKPISEDLPAVDLLKEFEEKPLAPFSECTETEQKTVTGYTEDNTCNFSSLLRKLGLSEYYPQKLTKTKIMTISRLSLTVTEHTTMEDMPFLYLYKLTMLNYQARYLLAISEKILPNIANDETEDTGDFFHFDDNEDLTIEEKAHIHPMDLFMAIFHCSNDFLRQHIFSKLSFCQLSLPLLVPDPFTGQMEFPLWPLRHITKSWSSKKQTPLNQSGKHHNKSMYNAAVPVVSFIRLGKSELNSKSQILNSVISRQKHSVFFSRHCEGSTPDNLLVKGLVEIAWYCPGGKDDDFFNECLAFLNLHGDATEYPRQFAFLQAVSTVIVVLLSEHPLSKSAKEQLEKSSVPLIALFSGKDKTPPSKIRTRLRIAAKNRNESELRKELIAGITQYVGESQRVASIENLCAQAKSQGFVVDEDKQSCTDGFAHCQKIMSYLQGEELSTLKSRILPLQGQMWHDWCKKKKQLYRLQSKRGTNLETQRSDIKAKMRRIRKEQLSTTLAGFVKSFLDCFTTPGQFEDTHLYTLQCLKYFLDDLTINEFAKLEADYISVWKKMQNRANKVDDKVKHNALVLKLDEINDKRIATTIGLRHIMREISQLYDALDMFNQGEGPEPVKSAILPKIGVAMLKAGYPLELMDGDAAHVPLTWIKAVFDELIQTIGDKKVFVLSILGLQSSGKSTLLNTMFGLQFSVSSGRCTRGVIMQLIQVEENLRNQLGYDYIIILDTEGLRCPEVSSMVSLNHDNELATFIIGIGDATVINIMGENPSEIHDILQICVQAFLRMKEVQIQPSCIFVHQNVAEFSAGEKNVETRRRLLEKLDNMAKMAATEENVENITCFSDVIHFDIESQVFYFTSLWKGDPPMAPPNPSYSQNTQDLKTRLLTIASWKKDIVFSTFSEFQLKIADLWNALLQENFVFSFKNTIEIKVYSQLEEKFGEWSWELRKYSDSLQNQVENEIYNNLIQDLTGLDTHIIKFDEIYTEQNNLIHKYFEEDEKKDILKNWAANIEKRFELLKVELIDGIRNNSKALLNSKKNRLEIDKKNIKFTKELTMWSKKLASELKANETSDVEVRKSFDSRWNSWTAEVMILQPPPTTPNIRASVEAILMSSFQKYGGIQDKVQSFPRQSQESFTFETSKHFHRLTRAGTFVCMYGSLNDHVTVLINTVSQAVEECIQSKRKMDFNENLIYEILKVIDKRIKSFHYVCHLTSAFKVDMSVYHCLKNVERFNTMHKEFNLANHPLTYLHSQREKYFQCFKNYFKGASSVTIFVDFFCKHIAPEFLIATNKKLYQTVADKMKSTVKAFSSTRSNMESHILKYLADKEDFQMYEEYLDNPEKAFKMFIHNEVDMFVLNTSTTKIYQEVLSSMRGQMLTEIGLVTTEVSEKNGNAKTWLNEVCAKTGSLIKINREELNGIENEDIQDWNFFRKEIYNSLESMGRDKDMDTGLLRWESATILIDQLQGCWNQCPFCRAICTNSIPGHSGKHSAQFHRCKALAGFYYDKTDEFVIDFCATTINSDLKFLAVRKNEWFKFKDYPKAGNPYDTWNIQQDDSEQRYWKWFICHFQTDLENKYEFKFHNRGLIPEEWKGITKDLAIGELKLS